MNSILQNNEFIGCPNCANLIASFAPTCSKCGLMMSEDGVLELALIDKGKLEAAAYADKLLEYSLSPFPLLAIAFFLTYFEPAFSVTLIFISMIYLGVFWWKFYSWYQRYLHPQFPDASYGSAKQVKKRAAVFGIMALVLAVILTYKRIL